MQLCVGQMMNTGSSPPNLFFPGVNQHVINVPASTNRSKVWIVANYRHWALQNRIKVIQGIEPNLPEVVLFVSN